MKIRTTGFNRALCGIWYFMNVKENLKINLPGNEAQIAIHWNNNIVLFTKPPRQLLSTSDLCYHLRK